MATIFGNHPRFVGLDYFDSNLVRSGSAFDLDRHVSLPFYVFIFTAARSLALLARGLIANSETLAVTGRLVSNRMSLS